MTSNKTQAIKIDRTLLLEIRTGIIEAIYNEDGLDGADGTYLLCEINALLGFDIADHTMSGDDIG